MEKESDRSGSRVTIRLKQGEKELLQEIANQQGISLHELGRRSLECTLKLNNKEIPNEPRRRRKKAKSKTAKEEESKKKTKSIKNS